MLTACGSAVPPQPRVTPASGPVGGGEAIRIEGPALTKAGLPVVYVGDSAALGVVIESQWLIRAITPKAEKPGLVDIRLVYEEGGDLVIERAFAYEESRGIQINPG